MGCNTSKETAIQPVAETADAKDENDGKPASARTITLKSASRPNSAEENKAEEDSGIEEKPIPDPEQAATKIQAVFRGHQTRKTMKQGDNKPTAETHNADAQDDHGEEEELVHAATKIQASFRGHMVRKQMEKEGQPGADQKPEDVEELDIDLTDPELNKAATKIQASFRGHMSRKDEN